MKALITVHPDGRAPRVEEAPDDWAAFLAFVRACDDRERELTRERARAELYEAFALGYRALSWLSRFEV